MSPRPSSRPGSAAQRTDPEAARAAAVSLLARRDLASGELRARLAARGFAPDAAQEAVQGLVREGVVNDERYARNYVAYHARRGQGPVRIALLLRGLGVDAALTEAALADGPDWAALARQVRQGAFWGAAAGGLARKSAPSPLFAVPWLFIGSYPRGHRCRSRHGLTEP